jgi:hypothetical protein
MVMRLFHFLDAAPDAADRRVRRLIPTERLLASLRERWGVTFTALSMIAPVGADALEATPRDDFVYAFVHHLAEHFRAGVRVLDHSNELALFTDRNAGLMVLLSLMLAGEPGDTFPPARPVPVSISALSRRFGVSRVHVRKLLRDATAAGLLLPANEPERVVLSPQAAGLAMDFFATALLFVSHCAAQALDEIKPG